MPQWLRSAGWCVRVYTPAWLSVRELSTDGGGTCNCDARLGLSAPGLPGHNSAPWGGWGGGGGRTHPLPPTSSKMGPNFLPAFGQSKLSLAPLAPSTLYQDFSLALSAPLTTQHHRGGGGGGYPGTPTTGLRERGNNTSRNTGRSGRQNTLTRCSMRREERVTVQGPVQKQQHDGMSRDVVGVMVLPLLLLPDVWFMDLLC